MAMKKSSVLRGLLERKKIVLRPLVCTALQARMAEATGFELVGISGAGSAAEIFGLPDAGLTTLTEMVENTQRICDAVNIPVIADCDTQGLATLSTCAVQCS